MFLFFTHGQFVFITIINYLCTLESFKNCLFTVIFYIFLIVDLENNDNNLLELFNFAVSNSSLLISLISEVKVKFKI